MTEQVWIVANIDSTVSRPASGDAHGRVIPLTDEEIRARSAEVARGLDALDDMGDAEEQRQTLDALMKAIDEEPLETITA